MQRKNITLTLILLITIALLPGCHKKEFAGNEKHKGTLCEIATEFNGETVVAKVNAGKDLIIETQNGFTFVDESNDSLLEVKYLDAIEDYAEEYFEEVETRYNAEVLEESEGKKILEFLPYPDTNPFKYEYLMVVKISDNTYAKAIAYQDKDTALEAMSRLLLFSVK